eukprot:3097482-Pleurochrysis_carterae.AAC.1
MHQARATVYPGFGTSGRQILIAVTSRDTSMPRELNECFPGTHVTEMYALPRGLYCRHSLQRRMVRPSGLASACLGSLRAP